MADSYDPEGLALELFKKRYAIHEDETWNEAMLRVVDHISMAESGEARKKFKEDSIEILQKNLFMPGGRILYGAGRANAQLLNCFVVPTEDSREGWGKTISDMIVISGTGGGLGINCSPIRPRHTLIRGTGGVATGAVSMMEIIDAAGNVIKDGGGRRSALMFALELSHGDILEFLDKKLNLDALTNANVSIIFDENPEDFFDLVKSNGTFEFKFRGKVIGEIPAKELWMKFIQNSFKSGEPGLLNGYYANRMSNIWYYKKLIATNPCAELWMTENESCCLGSLVLPRFISGRGIEWDLLKETVKRAVRFLDNVITINDYPLKEIEEASKQTRRIGLGVMGLHDVLLLNNMRYNSAEGLEFIDKVMKSIKNFAYEASVELAKEKGSFPVFDADKFIKSKFIKTLKPTIRKMILEYGIRNCALMTIPPTGTTSIVSGVTAGIEPMFAPAYKMRFIDKDDEWKERVVVHPLLKKFIKEGKDVSHFQGAYDLSLRDHFEIQRTCQKHIDNAVSKTLNVMPDATSVEELSEMYMEYFPELKGVTIYPDGSRENQPLTPIPLKDAIKEAKDAIAIPTTIDPCKNGSCDI